MDEQEREKILARWQKIIDGNNEKVEELFDLMWDARAKLKEAIDAAGAAALRADKLEQELATLRRLVMTAPLDPIQEVAEFARIMAARPSTQDRISGYEVKINEWVGKVRAVWVKTT